MSRALLSKAEIEAAIGSLADGWSGDSNSLNRTLAFPGFMSAVAFIDQMAPVAERMQHHPDLSLSWRTIELTLSTHSAGGVTALDVELAAELDRIAAPLLG